MSWPPTPQDVSRLRDTLAWVYDHSPHYRRVLDAAGVRPADLRSYDDVRLRVPRTDKSALVDGQRQRPPFGDFLAVPRDQIASLHTSPGPIYGPRLGSERGGMPVLAEAFRGMGVRPGDVAHVTLSYHVTPGGLRLHRALEEVGCLVINGGTGASRLQVQLARDYGATVYAGTPGFLATLGITAREMGLDPRRDLRYRVGFSTAEPLTPALRRRLADTFGIELFDHCGEAQIGPLAGECRVHDGMHLHAQDLFVELLHPETGEPALPGGVGEVVATPLGPRALPLVRYAPRDVFRLLPGACPCGDASPRVTFVGQVGAFRKIKGMLVHPAQVWSALGAFPEVGSFQIVVEAGEGRRYERVALRAGLVDGAAPSPDLGPRIAARLKDVVLIAMDVELLSAAQIPATAGPPGFADAIVDRRHDVRQE
jgi:phenylacetate-CoA ligase